LLASWSLFYNGQGYVDLLNVYPVDAKEIETDMKELNKVYTNEKKKR
jgi:hypothetical protein